MARQELIESLSHALNREVSTFLRYTRQGASIRGAQWESVRNMYLAEVPEEVGHAQYLMERIALLGGEAKLEPDLSPSPSDPRDMLRGDVEQERADVAHYIEVARLAESEGLIDLKLRMEEQAADEARHADEMERLLG